MLCGKCQRALDPEDAREHGGASLCEDCYMDALSPARSCDPWAVYTASRLADQSAELTPVLEAILACLDREGPVSPERVMEVTGLDQAGIQREFATLRHMKLAKAAPRPGGGRVLLRFDAEDVVH
jgi:hypothetical protein